MNKKRRHLIKSGMKLFAEKGYHRTSIEEIATKAGISKGGFYLYFHSKEEFICKSFQYFYQEIMKKIAQVNINELPPRDRLAEQINAIMNYLYEHRYIIIIHLQTDISLGNKSMKFFTKMKADSFMWLKENLLAIYGSTIKDYLLDIAIQFEGMMNGIFRWVVIDELPVERNRIGPYLVQQLEEMTSSMIDQDVKPLFSMNDLPESYQTNMQQYTVEEKLRPILMEMEEKIEKTGLSQKRKDELNKVLKVFLQIIQKSERQNIVMQGLLAHFNQIPDLHDSCKEIADLLQIELLE